MVEQPNGKVIHWDYMDDEVFQVQVARNRSAYATAYSFTGNAQAAIAYYKAINVGNGYKKRLMLSNTVIARCAS
jgi:hypothetical protein